jgi:endoglucanase
MVLGAPRLLTILLLLLFQAAPCVLGLGHGHGQTYRRSSSLRAGAHPTGVPWRTHDNALYYGDSVFRLKGVNWNGIESDCRAVHGLWENPIDFYMDILQAHAFNALRLPVSYEVMRDLTLPVTSGCVFKEPGASAMSVDCFLHSLLDNARRRGMFVLFDLHTIEGKITEYPWTDRVSEDMVVEAWVAFAKSVAMHPAVMGLEIKNEPHGNCTTTEFHRHAAKVIVAILEAVPAFPGVFFIDGTSFSPVDGTKAPWGGTFEALSASCQDDALCRLDMDEKLVFAPHVYGPDVRGSVALNEDQATFDRRFGFMGRHPFFNQSAIVVTEFGGYMAKGSADYQYFEQWRQYMECANLTTGAFFWTLPPSSDDTGGFIVADWRTPDSQKTAFLKLLQPSPSQLSY